MQSIYERIEHLIAERGMTKKAFCQQLKISTGNLGDWKRGKSTPSTNKLIEIAAFFDVSLDWLMIGRPSKEAMVREKREDYFFDVLRQLNCQESELSTEEQSFISEYIEFTRYRKSKESRNTQEFRYEKERKTEEDESL
ncbi:transcriptional regulator [Paenibacillus sp. Root52]|uniref:Transcriptional regulator with XRE-family HTH domain n=1 Tax=Paenibacillus amylolyticus TaxID=1451 RepID=A0AAP5H540_PAEAM|nr:MULTISPECIES: helix-turn-helix transcriptional regulator [Paenibacillus]KQY84295.1 transcriptional regulator [Paenibacillus sp. Root52]MCG7377440.1 helix-turn-helix domain-containing protein [Paenibacillus sp. ACRSA]MDR6724111.1 transcriptional regulator with XRE-family HTH domain [Paenibacillus amylolyticus]